MTQLSEAHHLARLSGELARLARYPMNVADGVGYLPFEQETANLFSQLVSSRYRAREMRDKITVVDHLSSGRTAQSSSGTGTMTVQLARARWILPVDHQEP